MGTYIPKYVRAAVQDAINLEFIAIRDTTRKWLAPELLGKFTGALELIRARLVDTVMDILTVEQEGMGAIHVLRINDSPAHEGILKITAIVHGGDKHRIARLQGENPNGEVVDLYSRTFLRRLEAERTLHQRLGNRKHPNGSKWYHIDPESAIESIREI